MFLDFCLKLNWLDEIAPWIYCSLKQLFLTHTPACGHLRNKLQFPWIFRYSIAWLAALSALIRFCKTEALRICGTAKHCIFGGVWEKHRCFFCSPGDKETKPCARGGRVRACRVHRGAPCAAAFSATAFFQWEGAAFVAVLFGNPLSSWVQGHCCPL